MPDTSPTTSRVDHIIIGVKDLPAAEKYFLEKYGLASLPGGRHEVMGTENYIVPLTEGYIEIAAVFDREAAAKNPFGRSVLEAEKTTAPFKLITFCANLSEKPQVTAERLGIELVPTARNRPDGYRLSWLMYGNDKSNNEPPCPFLITWDDPSERPDKGVAPHKMKVNGIEYLELAGDKEEFAKWVGPTGSVLPVRWVDGTPGIHAVGISTENGTIILKEE